MEDGAIYCDAELSNFHYGGLEWEPAPRSRIGLWSMFLYHPQTIHVKKIVNTVHACVLFTVGCRDGYVALHVTADGGDRRIWAFSSRIVWILCLCVFENGSEF